MRPTVAPRSSFQLAAAFRNLAIISVNTIGNKVGFCTHVSKGGSPNRKVCLTNLAILRIAMFRNELARVPFREYANIAKTTK